MLLYYIPNRKQAISRASEAADAGLPHIAEDDSQVASRIVVANGPDGGAGLLVFDPTIVKIQHAKYTKEWQVWQPSPFGDYWVGWWSVDSAPLAAYRRDNVVAGEWAALDNGQSIEIPTARQWAYDEDVDELYPIGKLPRKIGLSGGEFVLGDVKRKHQQLWKLAEDYVTAQEQAAIDPANCEDVGDGMVAIRFVFEQIHEFINAIIATNYRFGLAELTLCGGYDSSLQQQLIAILLDQRGFELLQKKRAKDRDTGDSLSGLTPCEPEAEQHTSQPLQIGEHSPQADMAASNVG